MRDFAQVKYDGVITEEVANVALNLLEVDEFGLNHIDRAILMTMIEKFSGVGLWAWIRLQLPWGRMQEL